jgi:hypothetical protein
MASINTPYATLSFVNAFAPRRRADGGEAVYNCSLIFDEQQQKSPAFKALQQACVAAAKKQFGDNVNLKTVMMPFRDGGEKTYDGYGPGKVYVNPWSKNKPGIVDRNREDILTKEEVWSGQLVRANVTPFAWTNSGKKGVSLGLNHLQIIESEGRQRLDGKPSPSSAFDDGEVPEGPEAVF